MNQQKTYQIDQKSKMSTEETFKISRFKELIKRTKPHKHSEYYEFIFLEAGEGFHTIDTTSFVVEAPDFFLLQPQQMHFWQFTAIPKGFVLLLKASEFDPITEPLLLEMLHQLSYTPRLSLRENRTFFSLLESMLEELNHPSPYTKQVLHGYLSVLMGKLLQLRDDQQRATRPVSELYQKFLTLLPQRCLEWHKVHEFANALCTTPQNLSHVCKKHCGVTAGELIDAQLLLEAKRYLLHTDNTINEVADILNFTDVSNFVKFFKRVEGCTPAHFRDQSHEPKL